MSKIRRTIKVIVILLFVLLFWPTTNTYAESNSDFNYEVMSDNMNQIRILKYKGSARSVTIPAQIDGMDVVEIGERAFYNNQTLEQLITTKGNIIRTIGEEAFSGCTKLNFIDIYRTEVQTIDNSAFQGCTKLENILLPTSLLNIGERAFYNCIKLNSVIFQNQVEVIEQMAFANCKALKQAILPDTVKQIWSEDKTGVYGGVFYGCEKLTKVTLTGKINKIPTNTFYGCTSLTMISMPNTVTEIGSNAFALCTNLSQVRFSNQLKKIGKGAFAYCSSLLSATLPDSLETLESGVWEEEYTFGGCTSLTNVVLGRSLSRIDINTFYGCSSLNNIFIPASVKTIGAKAFFGCTKLTKVYLMGDNPTFGDKALPGDRNSLTIYYQKGRSTNKLPECRQEVFYMSDTHKAMSFLYDSESDAVTTYYGIIGSTMSEPIPPERKGFDFAGWTVEGDSSYWDFSVNKVSKTVVLTAQWKTKEYIIKFDPTGGSLSETSRKVPFGSRIGALPVPVKQDYQFVGWYTAGNGEGKKYSQSTVMPNKDTKLYAYWKLRPTAPAAPKIKVVESGPTQIKITWNRVFNVTGYDIYRSTTANGKYIKIGSASDEAIGYINKNLTQGQVYYYRVKACRTVQGQKFSSSYSNKAYIKLTGKPLTPTLTVKKLSSTATDLTWGNVTGASGYIVYVKTKVTDKYRSFARYDAKAYGCYHKNLKKGTTYYYTVRAYSIVNGKQVNGKAAKAVKIKL